MGIILESSFGQHPACSFCNSSCFANDIAIHYNICNYLSCSSIVLRNVAECTSTDHLSAVTKHLYRFNNIASTNHLYVCITRTYNQLIVFAAKYNILRRAWWCKGCYIDLINTANLNTIGVSSINRIRVTSPRLYFRGRRRPWKVPDIGLP